MKRIVCQIDPKTKKCYEDTPANREAGLVTETNEPDRTGKVTVKDGVRIAKLEIK